MWKNLWISWVRNCSLTWLETNNRCGCLLVECDKYSATSYLGHKRSFETGYDLSGRFTDRKLTIYWVAKSHCTRMWRALLTFKGNFSFAEPCLIRLVQMMKHWKDWWLKTTTDVLREPQKGVTREIRKILLNWRVWSWLRLNVGGRPNTCKSSGNRSLWSLRGELDADERRTGE